MNFDSLFLLPIVAVGLAAAIHATAYLHGEALLHRPRFWGFFLATLAAMAGVVLASGKIDFSQMISKIYPIEQAINAFDANNAKDTIKILLKIG